MWWVWEKCMGTEEEDKSLVRARKSQIVAYLELQILAVSEEDIERTGTLHIIKTYPTTVIPQFGFFSGWRFCGQSISNLRSLMNK